VESAPKNKEQPTVGVTKNSSTAPKGNKFCMECGGKFQMENPKFCMDCGAKTGIIEETRFYYFYFVVTKIRKIEIPVTEEIKKFCIHCGNQFKQTDAIFCTKCGKDQKKGNEIQLESPVKKSPVVVKKQSPVRKLSRIFLEI
jgi:predicted amidophosphoribosyltransferase